MTQPITPLVGSIHESAIRNSIDGAPHLAVASIVDHHLSVQPSDVARTFVEYVRRDHRYLQRDYASNFVGAGWWSDPELPPHVSTNSKAHYQVHHHLAFDDFKAAAKVLQTKNLHITCGEDLDFAAWVKTNTKASIVDSAIVFPKKEEQ
jgi:hypothetical protein